MSFRLTSTAFKQGAPIPARYSLGGANVSPPLAWHDAPAGTKSFVLVVEDPDAPSGTFRHWGLCDIAGSAQRLDEGAQQGKTGVNDFGHCRYDGPQPPKGDGPHHYHFRLAALDSDSPASLPKDATVEQIWRAARPHILAQTQLVGTFER